MSWSWNQRAEECNDTAYNIMRDLCYFNDLGIPEEYEELYQLGEKKLIDSLAGNANDAISLIKTLDLNDKYDSSIMAYVDSITENLKTQKEKDDFTEFISSLEEKFPESPYINWGAFRFYKAMSSLDNILSSEKNRNFRRS